MRRLSHVTAILGLALALNLFGIRWGLPNAYSWSNDDITPKMPLSIAAIWSDGHHPYPYLHAWLDRALYQPYLVVLHQHGDIDPDCENLTKARCYTAPHEQLGAMILLARLLSAAMGVGIVWAVYEATRIAFRDLLTARMAALLAACSQVLVFYAHLGNVDTPSTFWFAISLVPFAHLASDGRARHYAAFGLFAGAALATKEAIVGAFILMLVAIAAVHVRRAVDRSAISLAGVARALADRRLLALAAALAGVYIVANNVLLNPAGYLQHVRFWIGGHGISGWNQEYAGQLPLLGTFLARLVEGMGLPLVVLCVAGLVWSLRRSQGAWWMLVPLVSYYLFTIALVRYVYVRFTMPVVVVMAIFGGVLAADLWRRRGRAAWLARPAVALVIAYGLLYSLQSDLMMRRDTRYGAEAWIRANVPGDAVVEVIGSKTYLPRLDYIGYSDKRIPWEELDAPGLIRRAPDYVVLSSRSISSADATNGPFVDDLVAGREGYHVVFSARELSPLSLLLGTSYVDPRLNPEVVVLKRREGPQPRMGRAPRPFQDVSLREPQVTRSPIWPASPDPAYLGFR